MNAAPALGQALGLEALLRGDPELADLAEVLTPLLAELRVRAGLLVFAEVPADTRAGDFEVWWAAYGKRVKKKAARAAWMAAKRLPPLSDLLTALALQKRTQRYQDGYQPDPERYITGERWNDDPKTMGRGKVDEAPAGLPESIRQRWPYMDRDSKQLALENLAVGGFRPTMGDVEPGEQDW